MKKHRQASAFSQISKHPLPPNMIACCTGPCTGDTLQIEQAAVLRQHQETNS